MIPDQNKWAPKVDYKHGILLPLLHEYRSLVALGRQKSLQLWLEQIQISPLKLDLQQYCLREWITQEIRQRYAVTDNSLRGSNHLTDFLLCGMG